MSTARRVILLATIAAATIAAACEAPTEPSGQRGARLSTSRGLSEDAGTGQRDSLPPDTAGHVRPHDTAIWW